MGLRIAEVDEPLALVVEPPDPVADAFGRLRRSRLDGLAQLEQRSALVLRRGRDVAGDGLRRGGLRDGLRGGAYLFRPFWAGRPSTFSAGSRSRASTILDTRST